MPFAGLLAPGEEQGEVPRIWRANFYRIERPRQPPEAGPELTAWAPTLVSPADFHKPARFGLLVLEG